jgi:hypothetical protein
MRETKRARSCEPPILLDSSAILTISEKPMHFIMNLTSSVGRGLVPLAPGPLLQSGAGGPAL